MIRRFLFCLLQLVAFAALLLLLLACGSSRQVSHTMQAVSVDSRMHARDSSLAVRHHLATEVDRSFEDVEIIHTVYDTNIRSPSSPPPVLSTTVYRKSRHADTQRTVTDSTSQTSVATHASQMSYADSLNIESVRCRTETTVPSQISSVLRWLCILLGLLFVYRMSRMVG